VTATAIALTIGDPNGIGPEIAVKAAAKLAREGGPTVVLIGDEFVIRHYSAASAGDLLIAEFDAQAASPGALQFVAVDALSRQDFRPGTPLAAGGRATVDYVAARAMRPRSSLVRIRRPMSTRPALPSPDIRACWRG
jgi:4-hydroxy-L-threonine phosphate dehydrogenase PdxA